MTRRPQKRRNRPGGGGSGKAKSWAGRGHHTSDGTGGQVFRSAASVARYLHASGRLAVVFEMTAAGRICDDAIVVHGSDALAVVPVSLLSMVIEKLPSLDTAELRQNIATYHAEQAGFGGRA